MSFLALFAVSFPVFAAMATVFLYLHIFTGSVGRTVLLVVPMDIFYRSTIISSSTVLPLNPFVNLSLAPLSLFLTYGPDLGVWPDCWVSAEFLRAPIPRKGSGSTTTTNLCGVELRENQSTMGQILQYSTFFQPYGKNECAGGQLTLIYRVFQKSRPILYSLKVNGYFSMIFSISMLSLIISIVM